MAGWNALLRWPQLGVTRGLPVPRSMSILQFLNRIGGGVPGPGAAVGPGPTSGLPPYLKRIGGAIPGQGGALLRGAMGGGVKVPGPLSGIGPSMNLMGDAAVTGPSAAGTGLGQHLLFAPNKNTQAATLPTTPAEAVAVATGAETTPTSPATIGRGLVMKPGRRSAVPMLGY